MAGVSFRVNRVAFVNRALQHASKDIQAGARKELHAIGELVAHDAELRALSHIERMPRSPQWAGMRVGQNNELVYVVPMERGTKTPRRKRKRLAPLMLRKAMVPALNRNEREIERRFEKVVANVTKDFNRGG